MSQLPSVYFTFPRRSGSTDWLRVNQTAVNGTIGAGVAYLPAEDFLEFPGKIFVYLGLDDSVSTICVPEDDELECPVE